MVDNLTLDLSLQRQFLDLSEKEDDILLLYGPSGVGKSLLVAQFPDVLILGCDPGKRGGVPKTADKYKPKVIKVESYSHMMGLIPVLKEKAGKEFGMLAIDSASFLHRMVMSNILTMVGREIARFEEWNLAQERMKKILERTCEIPCPIIFTALDGTAKDEITGKVTGGPDLPGKLQGEFPRYCSVVARLFVRTSYDKSGTLLSLYKFRVVGDDTWVGKDRTGLLPKEGETKWETFAPLFKKKEDLK